MHHSNEEKLAHLEKRFARIEHMVELLCERIHIDVPPPIQPLSGGGPGEPDPPGP